MTFVDRARDRMEWYRRGHNEHDWKSCDGQKPSEGSNPSHSAKNPERICVRDFYFFPIHYSLSLTDSGEVQSVHRRKRLCYGCFRLLFFAPCDRWDGQAG